jgi:hypothetical protein
MRSMMRELLKATVEVGDWLVDDGAETGVIPGGREVFPGCRKKLKLRSN